jgi:two-component system, NarL family, invasion response regulator UvrY
VTVGRDLYPSTNCSIDLRRPCSEHDPVLVLSAHDSGPDDLAAPGPGNVVPGFPGRVSVNVLCVDDHSSMRAALRALVASTPGFVQIGEAASGEDAIAAVEAVRTDLVLMDVEMPGIGGLNAAATIIERRPKVVVVLMSDSEVERTFRLADLDANVTFVDKSKLCPGRLMDVWKRRRKVPGC